MCGLERCTINFGNFVAPLDSSSMQTHTMVSYALDTMRKPKGSLKLIARNGDANWVKFTPLVKLVTVHMCFHYTYDLV